MAKRRRRRSRRFGDYISVPLGFGRMKLPSVKGLNPLGKSVNSTDVFLGTAVGVVGGGIIAKLLMKFWPTAPSFVQRNIGPISSIAAGFAAKSFLKGTRGESYYVGAALAGLAPIGWSFLQSLPIPGLSDYVDVNLGLLTDVNPMGLLVDEGSSRMSELAAYAMGNDEEADVYQY